MNVTGVRWTAEQVLALAPDEASRRAGSTLGTPGPWSGTGAADGVVWGRCEGGGRAPYRTVVDTRGRAYACTCPSRRSPCKHALGLLLLWASDGGAVPDGAEPPGWAARPARPQGGAGAAPADPAA
ncbi:SWIM zinc finger family protein, partial [Streptomyces sp. NPDC058757]|uniref:SWIM zinc finger family protein n=1 Tax=Streptomyces sp. NPDC058757 TaxID=3346626 RepID=UPI0036C7AF90